MRHCLDLLIISLSYKHNHALSTQRRVARNQNKPAFASQQYPWINQAKPYLNMILLLNLDLPIVIIFYSLVSTINRSTTLLGSTLAVIRTDRVHKIP